MIDRDHDLPIAPAGEGAGGGCRSSVYYKPRPVSAEDLKLMRRIDELHLEHPFAGARMLRDLLWREGVAVGRRHVTTLTEADGDRGDLSAAEHEQARAGTQGLSVSAARGEDRTTKPGLGDGHQLHPDAARLRLSRGGRRRLHAARFFRIACRSRWKRRSASTP